MTISLTLACVWAIVAGVVAMLPRRFHWPFAIALIATGIPLLGWVTYQNGPVWGIVVLAGGASVLRYPLFHLLKKIGREGSDRGPAE